MHLIVKAPFDTPRHLQGHWPPARTLGDLCTDYRAHVTACQVNDTFPDDWATYTPREQDTVTLFVETAATLSLATIITAVVVTLVSTAISIGLSYLIRALTPTPSNTAGKTEQVFGIAGLTNTTALGTPLFLVYGTRRVFGHIINTKVTISADGKSTAFAILYFMGEGPVHAIDEPEINDTPVAQFAGVTWAARLGDGNATMIPGFDAVSSVWSDGRQLAEATPLVYTTRGSEVLRVVLVFATPFLYDQDTRGNHNAASHTITIESALVSDGIYGEVFGSPLVWTDNAESTLFRSFSIELGSADEWLIRVTLDATTNEGDTLPTLYNVQEESAGSLNYPDSALLSFTGIASNQIQSFEQMRGSAKVTGRVIHKPMLVDGVWDGSTYEDAWSDNRAWVLRDLITDPRVGLGHRIDSSLWDDTAAVVAANYWDELADASIKRDRCDLLINDRKVAWDWINTILTEGRALLVPSHGKLKLVVDKADTPGLLYSVPGNIIDGTVERSAGDGQGRIPNTIRGQFADEEQAWRLQILEVKAEGTESDPPLESLVTLYTITSTARAFWLLRYQLLRSRLVQRHYRWQSPPTALVSEALDQVSLSYATPNFARGVSGFCPAGSTTTRLLLDRSVTLVPATTYSLLVRHQADNTVERTTVSTGDGTWGALVPAVAFTEAPHEGDLWALGVEDVALVTVVIESVTEQDDTYALVASEYQADVHTTPAPPTSPGAMTPGVGIIPVQLFDARATQVVEMPSEGIQQTFIQFAVTPQALVHAGMVPYAVIPANQIALSNVTDPYTEPYLPTMGADTDGLLDHYYSAATIDLTDGTGAGQSNIIEDSTHTWDGVNPPVTLCTLRDNWAVLPDATTQYQIRWVPIQAETAGFLVEEAPPGLPYAWVAVQTFVGFTGRVKARAGQYQTYFRFTALSARGLKPSILFDVGQIVCFLDVTGDMEGPGDATEAVDDGGC